MRTKSIILIATIFMNAFAYAQDYVPDPKDIELFFKSKTLVVLQDNPMLQYNFNIQDAVKSNWTSTEFEFISMAEFKEKRKNPNYSFLIMTKVNFEKDKLDSKYDFLQLLQGKNVSSVSQMPELCSVPLSYHGIYEDRYVYKLGSFVAFVQNHVKLLKEKPEIISANMLKYYNKNTKDIGNKTLYVMGDELASNANTLSKIKKVYSGKIKIVSMKIIEDAINSKAKGIVFLHKVGPENRKSNERCYKIIMGADDASFYYFDWHKINGKKPDGLMESDFKKLGK